MRLRNLIAAGCVIAMLSGCSLPDIKLFSEPTDPLMEFTLEGTGNDKVLVIPVTGVISTVGEEQLMHDEPSMVEDIVSKLRLAKNDRRIKAVLLKIDSPGGWVTASDILYNEILSFKQKTNAKIIVSMMGMAASGGYYVALPADKIYAHPTTITGSVGVIFMHPKVVGLMNMVGMNMEIQKSGERKDITSPFRDFTDEERQILQSHVDTLAGRFLGLVEKHRHPSAEALAEIRTAGIFLPEDALRLGLIDEIGYIDDALAGAKELAGIDPDAKVVIYRRTEYTNDTIYNSSTMKQTDVDISLVRLPDSLFHMKTGFYYMWLPGGSF